MKQIYLSVIIAAFSLGTAFSQTAVSPVLNLDFETEIIPAGVDQVSVVDSVDAVHPDPGDNIELQWMEYPGGRISDDDEKGNVLEIDNHSYLKIEESFFAEDMTDWSISYWYKWLEPGGRWWTGIGNFVGIDVDNTANIFQLHLRGAGGGDGAQLEGIGTTSENNWFQDSTWYHITLVKQDTTFAVYIADTLFDSSSGGANMDMMESLSYWITAKFNTTEEGSFNINWKDNHSKSHEGMIDDLRLWDIGLAASEVSSLYTSGVVERTYASSVNITSETGEFFVSLDDSLQLMAEVLPEDASVKSVTWSVEDGTGSAEMLSGGLLAPVSLGTVTVTATAADGSDVSASQEITIQGTQVQSITVTSESPDNTVVLSNQLQMYADVEPDNAADNSVTWSVQAGTGNGVISDDGLFTAVVAGDVTIIATANDGSGVTGSLGITITTDNTGINKNFSQVSVYPNPSDGVFKVDLGNLQSVNYEIFNVVGSRIKEGLLNDGSYIDLSGNDKGVYILKMRSKDAESVKRLIIR